MAARYWVGGTGTWDTSTTTHWASSSGAGGGASAPTVSDQVFFDGNSGTGTITASGNPQCDTLDTTGSSGLTWNNQVSPANNVTLGSNYQGLLTLTGFNSSSVTITPNGHTINQIYLGYVSGSVNASYTLAGDLVCTNTLAFAASVSTGTVTFNANGFNVTTGTVIRSADTTGSPPTVINMGAGTWTLTQNSALVWNVRNSTNLTINPSTSTIVMNTTSGSAVFTGFGFTYYNFTVNTSGTKTITGSNTWNIITLDATGGARTLALGNGSTQSINDFITTGQSSGAPTMSLISDSGGNAASLFKSAGAVSVDFIKIQDNTPGGGSTFTAGANSQSISNDAGWIWTPLPVSTFDSVTVSENVVAQRSPITPVDFVTVSEFINIVIPKLLVSVVDVVQVYESGLGSLQTFNVFQNSGYGNAFFGGPNGTATDLHVGGFSDSYYAYVQFDLTGITPHIGSAKMFLVETGPNALSPLPNIYKVTQTWDSSTMQYHFGGTIITAAQDGSVPTHEATAYTFAPPWSTVVGTSQIANISTIVESWANGSSSNFGVTIQPTVNNPQNADNTFGALNNATASNRPSLVVAPPLSMTIPTLPLSVFDSVTVTEAITPTITLLYISVFDQITVSESPIVVIPKLLISLFDLVTVSENVDAHRAREAVANELVTVSESITIFFPLLLLSLFDTVTVSEDVQIVKNIAPGYQMPSSRPQASVSLPSLYYRGGSTMPGTGLNVGAGL